MTPSGIEPATFRLVEQCLNQLRYRVSPYLVKGIHEFHCEHSSLQYPQQPVFTAFYSDPYQSSPHPTILYTSRFPWCSLPLRFSCKNFVNIYIFCYVRATDLAHAFNSDSNGHANISIESNVASISMIGLRNISEPLTTEIKEQNFGGGQDKPQLYPTNSCICVQKFQMVANPL